MKKIFLVVIALIVVVTILFTHQVAKFKSLPLNNVQSLFHVKPGTGFNQLCRAWQNEQYLVSCVPYRFYAKLFPEKFTLKAGVYDISNLTVLAAIEKINEGQQQQFFFTIIEGEQLRVVLKKLKESRYITYDVELKTLIEQLGLDGSAEGYLLPETYAYTAGTSAVSLLHRAKSKMDEVLGVEWNNRAQNLPISTPYQALILASIIEKETGYGPERGLISSVFINRLNAKMRLQTDPTVIYGLGEQFDGDIKRQDLRQYTPYNTYRIKGLPPTPIAMPSQDAIRAALNPEASDYFYFVAKGNGQHQFSKDLTAHNRAVQKYILKRRNDS
ncbi:endolytic transglycosylase MltG [Pseudoalteromonas aurantia]|uniref:Endolytic murein transglycosylase n=1 Tax=Pseudoalteromonas aurantia TaxID=43654 RepID=A0A5S3V9E9_9GAMM|nr:endolytic transglycosylase MltG [Pseudoalteromonas aurantia]TMO58603.1 endolytic transglycosylase MltG [Pseudoalteromonas aurantia]TMO68010.1 endolytic transglycosylase MltG [Pseudoalteromonas aurantia]